MSTGTIRLTDWARALIVDPLDKQPLTLSQDKSCLHASYGRSYPCTDGIYDLRVLRSATTHDQKIWKAGQNGFERLSRQWESNDCELDYVAELNGVAEVYQVFPIEGDCLDVGGHQGRLRVFLVPGQHYITCDPFLGVFRNVENQANLIKAYPFLLDPVDFVCCDAEFLPFRSASFDTVHMRSVIDHFLNPELALLEAYRVLKSNGSLIVGSYVQGGRTGKRQLGSQVKEILRSGLSMLGFEQYTDHHVWHPTYHELTQLITSCGFIHERTFWQKGYNDTVCYIKAVKVVGRDGKRNECGDEGTRNNRDR
jgi:SAM-dependent methyltransferase